MTSRNGTFFSDIHLLSAQSSLSIFAQKYLRKREETYFFLQNKYLHIYEVCFGVKMLRNNFALNYNCLDKKIIIIIYYPDKELVQESL